MRRMTLGLMVTGALMTVVGLLGLAFGWGSSSATARPSAAKPATTTSAKARSTPSTSATTPSSAAAESPSSFFDALQTAVRNGDRAFLTDRLHPAVTKRYGLAQCQAHASQLADPTVSLRLVKVTGPVTFDYASDGLSTPVPNTYVFDVDGTAAGRTGPRQYHFALVGGRFRTFADCGNPISNG